MTHEKTSSYCKPCQVGTDLFEAQFEKIFSDFRYFPVPVKSSGAIMVCIDLSGLQSCLNMWQFGDGSLGIKRRFLLYLIISIYIPQTPVCHMSKLRPWCWVVLQGVVDVLGQVNMFGGGGGGFQASQGGQLLKGTDELKYRENICTVTV